MSIENTLERIADSLERLVDLQAGRNLLLESAALARAGAAEVAEAAVEKRDAKLATIAQRTGLTVVRPEVPLEVELRRGPVAEQVVSFPSSGVQAHTFLTFSLSDDPASPHFGDYTKAYSAKQWVRMPFSESEITGHPDYRTTTVSASAK